MALLSSIKEPFTGTTTPTGWTQTALGSASFTLDQTGATVNLPATTSSSTDGDMNFTATNDMTGSFARLNVTGVSGAGATHTDNVLRVRINTANYLTIFYEAGTLFFSKVVASAQTNIASVAYNPTTHAWWQIREKNGVTYWETSADGVNWTIQTQQNNPIAVTALDVLIGALCFGADTSPAPFKFRYFNYPLPGTTTSTSSISTTSSSISTTSASSTSSSISTTSNSTSTSSTSSSISSTSSSISSTSSSVSSTSASSTSASTSISSTSSSISSTSFSSTSMSSTSSSTSISSTSSSISSTSSSISSTSSSVSSTSQSSTSSSSSTSTTAIPTNLIYSYQDSTSLPNTVTNETNIDSSKNVQNQAVDDGDYFIQYGSEYVIEEYKYTNTNNTDAVTLTWKGRSTESCVVSPLLIQVYNLSNGVFTYYFNASQAGPTDAGAIWSNLPNAFDGNILTFANSSNNGGGSTLNGTGTTAPIIGPTISQVRARAYLGGASTGSLFVFAVDIFSGATDLGTMAGSLGPIGATPFVTLSVPSGGWTWAKINALQAQISGDGIGSNKFNAARVEIEVTAGTGLPWETLARETRVPADTDFTMRVTQSANMSNYYDANNTITFRSYQQVL